MILRPLTFSVLLLAVAVPGDLTGQVRASERATVSQTIDGTTITIDYSRPRVRGRGKAFGDVAKIGNHRWTPGANWASTITSNRSFRLNGHDVPEGTWSMWIDLEPDAWTMILDPADSVFHTAPPPDRDEQIRFDVERRDGPFVESMLFWIPETRIDGFDLLLGWGTTEILFEVEVESTFETKVAEPVGRPLEGKYRMTFVPRNASGTAGPSSPFDLTWSEDRLHFASSWPGSDEAFDGWLLPRGADYYDLGWVVAGELWEITPGMTLEVVREGQRVIGFDVRSAADNLMATIRRVEG